MDSIATSLKQEFVKAISGYESDVSTLSDIQSQIEYVNQCRRFGIMDKGVADCILKVLVGDFIAIRFSMMLKEWAEKANR
jgi:hypothetical protein